MTVDATQNNPAVPAVPPGSRIARPQEFRVELKSLPTWIRPEVTYWYSQWLKIRDACAGERPIKELRTYYLPAMAGMDPTEYDDFLNRATYYNFSSRTVSSMSGSIFRRQPLVEGLSAALKLQLQTIAKDHTNFDTFASGACEEIVKLGRYGILVDLPPIVTTTPRPYLCGYTAENILDWDEGELDDGTMGAVRIVLRESNDGRDVATQARQSYVRYRELVLLPNAMGKLEYTQFVYSAINADATLDEKYRGAPIVPLLRGSPLNFIPFQLIGPHLSSWSVEKPPLEDIALLNLSHYRSYGSLEHGRFFVGFPIYTAEEPTGGGTLDYKVGPSRIWVMPPGGTAKILEMNGQGLKFLENALFQKEMQAVSIGSKMLGAGGQNTPSKGADQLILEERNEQSVLLKLTRQMDTGFTNVLRWWAQWAGATFEEAKKIQITFNKDFLFDGVGAREFRAVHAMYKDGVLPIEVVFYYFKKAYLIPDWMLIDEFKTLLEKTNSFPGQPDAEARAEGFQTRQQQLDDEHKKAGIDIQQQEIDLQEEVQQAADKVSKAQLDLQTAQQEHQQAQDVAKQKLAEKAQKTADRIAAKPAPKIAAPGGSGGPPAAPKTAKISGGIQPPPKISPPATAQPGVKPTGKT